MDDPMPEFIIKAKDRLAIPTIIAYKNFCRDHNLWDQAHEVTKAHEEFFEWQYRNPDKVKMPDHEHIPVKDDTT